MPSLKDLKNRIKSVKSTQKISTVLLLLAGLTACEQQSQYTSGKDYLARHDQAMAAAKEATPEASADSMDFQKKLREAASIEPSLKFPLRVGLARIENGALVAIPSDEGQPWRDAAQNLQAYGDFVAVSPLVAKMTAESVGYESAGKKTESAVDEIRLAAARQHLDAVLIYEVATRNSHSRNALTLLNLTIIGAYIMPSASTETLAYGQGMFIDVMSGYPYGTLQATVKEADVTTSHGLGEQKDETESVARTKLAAKLAADAEKMLVNLAKASRGKS